MHLLSNHYNLTRSEYYRQLDRSSAGNNFQLDVIWRDYVHGIFSHRKSEVDRRRRT